MIMDGFPVLVAVLIFAAALVVPGTALLRLDVARDKLLELKGCVTWLQEESSRRELSEDLARRISTFAAVTTHPQLVATPTIFNSTLLLKQIHRALRELDGLIAEVNRAPLRKGRTDNGTLAPNRAARRASGRGNRASRRKGHGGRR